MKEDFPNISLVLDLVQILDRFEAVFLEDYLFFKSLNLRDRDLGREDQIKYLIL